MRKHILACRAVLGAVAVVSLSSCQGVPSQAPAAVPAHLAPAPARVTPHAAIAAMVPAPPLTLTASDGTGLKLTELTARAAIEAPLAFTELHLAFQNPRDRVLEGTFKITLPQGATISRFAMKIGEQWQEAEMVERQAARVAYEDFLHRKQDPALLEQSAGNEFSARVFPIPANATKEIIVSYSQELTARAPYAIALRGLPEIASLDLAVSDADTGAELASRKDKRVVPTEDFALDARAVRVGDGLRSGELALVRVTPIPATAQTRGEPIDSAVVLFDTSASRALGFAEQARMLARVVETIARERPGAKLAVACFDQTVEAVFEGDAAAFGEAALARIRARDALGASDVGKALAWANVTAKRLGAKRVVVVSDGVSTAGEAKDDKLVAAARGLTSAGVERLDAIAVGGIRDDGGLKRLVTAGLAKHGIVADGTVDAAIIAQKLGSSTRSGIALDVVGSTWSWPRVVDGVQPGDEVFVYAEVPPSHAIAVSVGGAAPFAPELRAAPRPLVERGWAQAKIASLVASEAKEGGAADTQRKIVELSTSHRVLSPYTALLVLETEQDYARFRIDRKAVADILAIEGGRIGVAHPTPVAPVKPPPAAIATTADDALPARATQPRPEPAKERGVDAETARGNMWGQTTGEAFGAGGLGLSGVGEGGGGSGSGIGAGRIATREAGDEGTMGALQRSSASASSSTVSGFGGAVGHGSGRAAAVHRTSSPQLRAGATVVSGSLPVESIQRVIRLNRGRFRACYQEGLLAMPGLSGRVTVRFVIDRAGAVSAAVDGGSEMPSRHVTDCVLAATRALAFPAPESGLITVTYPFVFTPDTDAVAAVPQVTSATPLPPSAPPTPPPPPDPYTGKLKLVMDALADAPQDSLFVGTRTATALEIATSWHREDPGDVMALVALGEVYEKVGAMDRAARAYGSIIDLFPSRADFRRFAGERLERVKQPDAAELALDTFEKAEAQRPDHPSSHRLLAYARLRKGDHAGAFDAMLAGVKQKYPDGRFAGVERVLREDLGLIGAAWAKAEPARRADIERRVRDAGATVENAPSSRFVLNWETDANDVDLHVYDAKGNHAFYSAPKLVTGGELYADVTTGYGPECFTIRGPKSARSGPYRLQAHYYARGPMGYGMGKIEIIEHDGSGGLTIEERPFVVMVDQAFVELGVTR